MAGLRDRRALLVDDLHRVLGNRDAERRRVAIDERSADDVGFVDPEESLVGTDALDRELRTALAAQS